MFPPLQFTLEMRQHYCAGKYGLGKSRNDWYGTQFFGTKDEIKHASRLIFPNGDLDPWMPGGVLENLSEDLIAIMIEGGAHHLDLRWVYFPFVFAVFNTNLMLPFFSIVLKTFILFLDKKTV